MNKYVYRLALIFFILGLFVTVIDLNAFNQSYYIKMYEQEAVYDTLKLEENTVMEATEVMLAYLKDKRTDMDYKMSDGQSYYSQRELDHMVDVKELYQGALLFRNVSLIFSVLIIFDALFRKRYCELQEGFTWSLSVLAIIFMSLGLYAWVDFDHFWIQFHHLFFSNDLWLLDPAVDRLISMVPLPFFMGLVLRIVLSFMVVLGLCFIAYLYFRKKCYDDSRGITSN